VEQLDNRGKPICFLDPGPAERFDHRFGKRFRRLHPFRSGPGDRLGHAVAMPRIFSNQYADLAVSAPRAFEETGDPETDRWLGSWGAVYLVRGRAEFPQRIDFSLSGLMLQSTEQQMGMPLDIGWPRDASWAPAGMTWPQPLFERNDRPSSRTKGRR
jgi:hypothetical protein